MSLYRLLLSRSLLHWQPSSPATARTLTFNFHNLAQNPETFEPQDEIQNPNFNDQYRVNPTNSFSPTNPQQNFSPHRNYSPPPRQAYAPSNSSSPTNTQQNISPHQNYSPPPPRQAYAPSNYSSSTPPQTQNHFQTLHSQSQYNYVPNNYTNTGQPSFSPYQNPSSTPPPPPPPQSQYTYAPNNYSSTTTTTGQSSFSSYQNHNSSPPSPPQSQYTHAPTNCASTTTGQPSFALPTPSPSPSPQRTYAFSSAEEAAAERRRRKRRLRIEPPLYALRRDPNQPPPQRDPNAPRLPDSTSALVGPRLNLHNRVQSLIRATDLDAAQELAWKAVFSRTRPTVFTCNAIIAAMYRAKRYDDAVKLFDYFFNQSTIIPNIVSYNNLINTHCDEGRADVGLEVYKHILENAPFSPSPVTYRHLTKGLIDAGRIGEAVDLLREMLNKGHGADSLVYNNVISGFLKLGNLEKANELFDELKERCLVYDGIVNATYMDWWFNQGKEKEAMESYKSLMDRKFKMTPATCNVLLETLLKHGRKREALELFDHMLDNHTPPNTQAVNSETFNIMVNECFKLGNLSEAIDTFKKVGTKPASRPFAMDVAGYNNIITRFCEHGVLAEAENFFNILTSKSLSPDCATYRTLVDTYLKMERIDDAMEMLNKMVDANLRVVSSFGTRVFEELIKNGKASECAQIMTKLGERDPKPDAPIYDVVIRELCNVGALDAAQNIINEMMRYRGSVTPSLREFVCEAFGKVGRAEEIDRIFSTNRFAHPGQFNTQQR